MNLIFAASAAYNAGYNSGQILIVLLMSWGIYKCAAISRRPATNTKCALSLMLLLIAWLIGSASGTWIFPHPALRILLLFMVLICFGLLIAALVLAILGLVEYANQRDRYNQGRAQAIWSLVLCGLFFLLVSIGFVQQATRSLTLSQPPQTGQPVVLKDLNCKFSPPLRPWVQANPAKFNPAAKLAFLRSGPEVFFVLIPEQLGNTELTTDGAAEFARARMASMAESAQVLSQRERTIGKLHGVRVESAVRFTQYNIFYVQWFCVTNGWSYQLTAWGRIEDQNQVAAQASEIMDHFELLDYDKHAPARGRREAQDYQSSKYQYAVHCGDGQWLKWATLDNDCAYASFGAMHQNDVALVVSAISLLDLNPPANVIYRGLLSVINPGSYAEAVARGTPIHQGLFKGIETTYDQTGNDGKEYSYQVRVLQGGGFAYLVAAWLESNRPDKDAILSNALSRVEFPRIPEATIDPSAMDAREKRTHRMLLNGIGSIFFRDQRYEESAKYFQQAVALDGLQKGTSYLLNLVDAYENLGRYREALDELERHPDFVDSQPPLSAARAYLESKNGRTDLALTNYTRLFATGFNSEEYFKEYINLLARNDRVDDALSQIKKYLQNRDSTSLRREEADLLKRQKKYDEAIALLQDQRQKSPLDPGIAYSLGDALILAGRANEALALGKKLLEPPSAMPAGWFIKGRAELALKWYRESRESFQRAHDEFPSDADIKSYLDYVSGIMGEGNHTLVEDSISPVPLPDELRAKTSASPPHTAQEDGAYYSQYISAVSFQRGKEQKSTEYVSVKILSATGVSAFSTFQIAFNPQSEQIFVNRLAIKDPSGSLVSTGRVENYYLLDDHANGMATSKKVLNVPVPGLQPGCSIELECTRRQADPAEEFSFLSFAFSRAFPAREMVLYVTGDTNGLLFASSPPMDATPAPKGICWRQTNTPPFRWEPLQPQLTDYVPNVWVADAAPRWRDLVTNYLAQLHDRLELTASTRELAKQIIGAQTNTAQKIAAIAAYVQTNYTYKAIEFGRRARIPLSVEEITRNKYGDCKDHALLAAQLLKAVDVPASLALANFGSPIRKDLPSLDQFDHMLVSIPQQGQDVFLDCTSKGGNLATYGTPGLGGHEILILDQDNPRFGRVPDYPANLSSIHSVRSVQFTNETDALVDETLTFSGAHGGYLRNYLRNQTLAGRHDYIAAQLITAGSELLDMNIKDLDQSQSPLVLHMTYLVRSQFQALENQMIASPPIGFERAWLLNAAVESRTTPFEIDIPMNIDVAVQVAVPPHYKARRAAEGEQKIENRFVTCTARTENGDNSWHTVCHISQIPGRFPGDDYANHCRTMQQAVDLLKPRLVCERAGP